MTIRRWTALTAASALLLSAPLSAVDARAQSNDDARGQRTFVGSDGVVYPSAPMIWSGSDGYLFIGEDFDTACYERSAFRPSLVRLGRLAKLIERSGRRVAYSVAPNKSSVVSEVIDAYPHGACARRGIRQQNRVLDTFADPNYVPARKALDADRRQTYWRTDAHWSTVGASVYARQLARHLSPALGKRQRYRLTSRTELGDLLEYLLIPEPETAPAALPATGVRVQTKRGSDGFDPVSAVSFDHSWLSTPARKTWRGKTVVVGDSFTYLALEPLRPLFAKGQFLWIASWTLDDIIRGIVRADTVVLTVVQRFLTRSPLITEKFYRKLRAALLR